MAMLLEWFASNTAGSRRKRAHLLLARSAKTQNRGRKEAPVLLRKTK
jgi:hypothetical protein